MTAVVIAECLNGIVLALTPVERWEAARRFNSNFVVERWFILVAVAAIVILTALLVLVSFNRARQERKTTDLIR